MKLINGKKVVLEIQDTAGAENKRNSNKIIFKNTKIVLLIYDFSKEMTFINLNNIIMMPVR